MSSPYNSTSVSGYNANPPPDDGTSVSTNLVTWAVIKTKLGDPLNTFATSVNSNLTTAFGKILGGGSVVNTGVNYAAGAADQGRLIRTTVANVTITTPDATSVLNPFAFAVLNMSTGNMNVGGFGGTQTIDGSVSAAFPAGTGAILFTDGSNWFTSGQPTATQSVSTPQGRLTLTSGTPVLSGDVSAATAVYYTPYVGNQCPIPNGTVFKQNSFAELTLTLNNTNYVANTIYDVFIFLDPGDGATVRIGSGPAWSTSTAGSGARGSGAGTAEIARLSGQGMYTNNNAMTMRNNATTYSVATKSATYVGSIFIDGTNGQLTCHFSAGQSRKFGVWNAFNRVPIILQAFDSTSAWSYNSATVRQSNAAAGNKNTSFTGLAEEWVHNLFTQNINANSATDASIGIGYNATNAYTGTRAITNDITNNTVTARYPAPPSLGVNNINCCEQVVTSGTMAAKGTILSMNLTSVWNG